MRVHTQPAHAAVAAGIRYSCYVLHVVRATVRCVKGTGKAGRGRLQQRPRCVPGIPDVTVPMLRSCAARAKAGAEQSEGWRDELSSQTLRNRLGGSRVAVQMFGATGRTLRLILAHRDLLFPLARLDVSEPTVMVMSPMCPEACCGATPGAPVPPTPPNTAGAPSCRALCRRRSTNITEHMISATASAHKIPPTTAPVDTPLPPPAPPISDAPEPAAVSRMGTGSVGAGYAGCCGTVALSTCMAERQ